MLIDIVKHYKSSIRNQFYKQKIISYYIVTNLNINLQNLKLLVTKIVTIINKKNYNWSLNWSLIK